MAKYELSTYDEEENKLNTFERNNCPTKVYMRALELLDKFEKGNIKEPIKQLKEIFSIVKSLFPDITEEEYYNNTYREDIFSTFYQICGVSAKSVNSKNA